MRPIDSSPPSFSSSSGPSNGAIQEAINSLTVLKNAIADYAGDPGDLKSSESDMYKQIDKLNLPQSDKDNVVAALNKCFAAANAFVVMDPHDGKAYQKAFDNVNNLFDNASKVLSLLQS